MWALFCLLVITSLFYFRASLIVSSIALALFLFLLSAFSTLSAWLLSLYWLIYIALFAFLLIKPLRRRYLSQKILRIYQKFMPSMSRTESEALNSGTVGWEGELFSGYPDWHKLFSQPTSHLSKQERDFINGPVNQLCRMIDDWEINFQRRDLPPKLWQFIKDNGFFAMIIPKKYGGLGFSAYAHSQVLTKISSKSTTVGITVSVPNSLGPAELLLEYGTKQQKEHYLPRLAAGKEIPAFALTSPEAGSDAAAMPDYGTVCYAEYQGKKTLGIRLNWNKRYITLAPVATVLGLAFKLYDPEHLISEQEDIGITCALIPTDTPGVIIGRRHYPSTPFQNGPTQGKDVFIPLDWVIGGKKMVGQGWRMLMECLAAGRAISLPSMSIGGMKRVALMSGAYARIRKQFSIAIGKFEGIQHPLAKMAANTYIADALLHFIMPIIDQHEKPAVPSAIAKYHTTEMGRENINYAFDIHGGKAICLGPKNYLASNYLVTPVSITVEGANILTRSMIIFGQGVMRCHPYMLAELQAAQLTDKSQALVEFDQAFFSHIGFSLSNTVRSMVLALTAGKLVQVPKKSTLKHYYQRLTRFSASFACLVDFCVVYYGARLKRKESVSARLGDVLSYMYMLSAILKYYFDGGEPREDSALVKYTARHLFVKIEQSLHEIIMNLPNLVARVMLRMLIFPLGRHQRIPSDSLTHFVAHFLLYPNRTRERLLAGIYQDSSDENNPVDQISSVLEKVLAAEAVDGKLLRSIKKGTVTGKTYLECVADALAKQVIDKPQAKQLEAAYHASMSIIQVDDFSPEELSNL
jgi:acyl-CoA dehydrogenase